MVTLIKAFDKYLGGFLCSFFGIFKSKKAKEIEPGKILVIQLWGIGETVLTLPAIEALRKKFPNSKIDVLATPRNKDVYFNNSNINSVLSLNTNPFSILFFILDNPGKYDVVIDMEEYLNISSLISFFCGKKTVGYSHGKRSKLYDVKVDYNDQQHASQTFLDLVRTFGIEHKFDKLPKLNFTNNDRDFVESFLLRKNFVNFIIVAPGAAESAKSRIWPLERYSQLCDEIIEKYKLKIIFIGSKNERVLIDDVISKMNNHKSTTNSAGIFSLTQLFYFMTKGKLFIGNDSGPMHIAAAQEIKTIGLFGPNIPTRFGPFGRGNTGLYKGRNCEFSPCINVHKGQVPDCLYPKNSDDYQKCMKNIDVNDVLKEVEKIL